MALTGRDHDHQVLRLFAQRARRRGGALVLTGDPGSGRTTLLHDLAGGQAEAGTRVLRTVSPPEGLSSEYADLDRMIAPFYEDLPVIAAPLRESLSVAVGLKAGPPPSSLSVGSAVTMLLRQAARRGPTLIVVDDAHRWDPASRAVLGFAGRRLDNSRMGLIAAHPGGGDLAEIPAHHLGPLDADAARAILRSTAGDLAGPVSRRVLADAAGNPLALTELPKALSDQQRAGHEPLPPLLAVTSRLQQAYASAIRALPALTRHLLLIAALDGTGDLRPLIHVAGGDGGPAGLTAAEHAGLIRVDDAGRLRFAQPVIAMTVAALAGAVELRRAHHVLAEALAGLDPARTLVHVAQTAIQPDEAIAGRLADAADRRMSSGRPGEAASLWARAAGLTPVPELRRSRWHAAAALRATALADPDGAQRMILKEPGGGLAPAIVDVTLALRDGTGLAAAHERLLRAVRTCHAGPTRHLLAAAIRVLMRATWHLDSEHAWVLVGQLSSAPGPAGPRLPAFSRAHHVELLTGQTDDRLEAGPALAVIASRCLANWPTGRWTDIDELTSEYDDIAARHDRTDFLSPLPRLAEGLAAAARGDVPRARAAAAGLSSGHGGIGPRLAHHVYGLLALGDGDFDLAHQHLSHVPHQSWSALDVTEAAWLSDHPDSAAACVRTLSRLAATALSERLSWIVLACRAVSAEPRDAESLFAAAVSAPEAQQRPFELARVQLAFGEHLRARREARPARFHLHQAARTFRRLGAPAWQARTQRSLRALGVAARTAPPIRPGEAALSPVEQRLVRLAASGLTNRQIADAVALSPRTVASYLYRAFPKLGVTSRTALRDALPT